MTGQEKSAWQKYKEKNGVTPLDLFKPHVEKASKEVADNRLGLCKSCPELRHALMQCKKCGCLMTVKTTLQGAKCPLGKW